MRYLIEALVLVAVERTVQRFKADILPLLWLAVLVVITTEILLRPQLKNRLRLFGVQGGRRMWWSYPLVAFIGAVWLCLYWLAIQGAFSFIDGKHGNSAQTTAQADTSQKPTKPPSPNPSSSQNSQGNSSPNASQQNQGNGTNVIQQNSPNSPITIIPRDDPKAKELSEKLDKFLKSQEQLTPEKLLLKYPLGYVIFNASYSNAVFPYQTDGELKKWNIDWSSFRFENSTGEMVSVKMPDFSYRSGTTNNLDFKSNTFGCLKRVGGFCGGGVLIQNGGVKMLGEILKINPDSVDLLIGF